MRATYRDGSGGTGVVASSVRLLVDGHDVTAQARVTASTLSVRLTGAKAGTHTVRLQVRDRAGNTGSVTNSFTVGGGSGDTTTAAQGGGTTADSSGSAAGGSGASVQAGSPAGGTAGPAAGDGVTAMPGSDVGEAAAGADPAGADPAGADPAGGAAAPEAAFPDSTRDAEAESAAALTRAAGSDSPERGRAAEERKTALLIGLVLLPVAAGFAAAGRQHRRLWAGVTGMRKKTPGDRPLV